MSDEIDVWSENTRRSKMKLIGSREEAVRKY
jgi:hypothetical protein